MAVIKDTKDVPKLAPANFSDREILLVLQNSELEGIVMSDFDGRTDRLRTALT